MLRRAIHDGAPRLMLAVGKNWVRARGDGRSSSSPSEREPIVVFVGLQSNLLETGIPCAAAMEERMGTSSVSGPCTGSSARKPFYHPSPTHATTRAPTVNYHPSFTIRLIAETDADMYSYPGASEAAPKSTTTISNRRRSSRLRRPSSRLWWPSARHGAARYR
jgi:hypothetical protein